VKTLLAMHGALQAEVGRLLDLRTKRASAGPETADQVEDAVQVGRCVSESHTPWKCNQLQRRWVVSKQAERSRGSVGACGNELAFLCINKFLCTSNRISCLRASAHHVRGANLQQ